MKEENWYEDERQIINSKGIWIQKSNSLGVLKGNNLSDPYSQVIQFPNGIRFFFPPQPIGMEHHPDHKKLYRLEEREHDSFVILIEERSYEKIERNEHEEIDYSTLFEELFTGIVKLNPFFQKQSLTRCANTPWSFVITKLRKDWITSYYFPPALEFRFKLKDLPKEELERIYDEWENNLIEKGLVKVFTKEEAQKLSQED